MCGYIGRYDSILKCGCIKTKPKAGEITQKWVRLQLKYLRSLKVSVGTIYYLYNNCMVFKDITKKKHFMSTLLSCFQGCRYGKRVQQ